MKRFFLALIAGLFLTLLSLIASPIKTLDINAHESGKVFYVLFGVTDRMPKIILSNNLSGQEGRRVSSGGACLDYVAFTNITSRGYPSPTVVHLERRGSGSCDGGGNIDRTELYLGGLLFSTLFYGSIALVAIIIVQKVWARVGRQNN